jgi:hypothetical protein
MMSEIFIGYTYIWGSRQEAAGPFWYVTSPDTGDSVIGVVWRCRQPNLWDTKSHVNIRSCQDFTTQPKTLGFPCTEIWRSDIWHGYCGDQYNIAFCILRGNTHNENNTTTTQGYTAFIIRIKIISETGMVDSRGIKFSMRWLTEAGWGVKLQGRSS